MLYVRVPRDYEKVQKPSWEKIRADMCKANNKELNMYIDISCGENFTRK